ncbi:hypothetical protein P280DRAFT_480702 [Massarina eburnea CBS 473.64]|uniref:Uncharacterized protein n=1 Tax=Massarina eburnea CBS 473.64 TaxID=1395130 RepID=A0A6A6RXD1_9PLEO|nr:hypothetical protein P280DRAFT_480702 [Massarina eburnea CBS 473.64]
MAMGEIEDYIELNERDEYCPPHTHRSRDILTPDTAMARLSDCHPTAALAGQPFDTLVHFIAVHLLASCYTLPPVTSANNLPPFQQRTGSRLITALRLHSLYRFSPAAGYNAREPSRTSPWPGHYSECTVEKEMADMFLRRRSFGMVDKAITYQSRWSTIRRQLQDTGQWSDGPADVGHSRESSNSSATLSSTSPPRSMSRLFCQPSAPLDIGTKAHYLCYPLFSKKNKHAKRCESPKPMARPRPFPLQRISHPSLKVPSANRPPGTQSAHAPAVPNPGIGDVSLGAGNGADRPTSYVCHIPEIRRISASTQTASPAESANDYLLNSQGHVLRRASMFDPTRLCPWGSVQTLQDSGDLMDEVLSLSSDTTVRGRNSREEQRSDYFNSSPPSTQEDDVESSSEDSVEGGRKRRCGLVNALDSAAEFSHRLRKRETGASAE